MSLFHDGFSTLNLAASNCHLSVGLFDTEHAEEGVMWDFTPELDKVSNKKEKKANIRRKKLKVKVVDTDIFNENETPDILEGGAE